MCRRARHALHAYIDVCSSFACRPPTVSIRTGTVSRSAKRSETLASRVAAGGTRSDWLSILFGPRRGSRYQPIYSPGDCSVGRSEYMSVFRTERFCLQKALYLIEPVTCRWPNHEHPRGDRRTRLVPPYRWPLSRYYTTGYTYPSVS